MLPIASVTTAAMPQICGDRFGECRIAVVQVDDELFSEAAPRHTSISQKEVVLLEWRRLSALALTRHRSVLADAATSVDPCAVPQCAIGPESASQLFPTELRQDSSRSMAAQCHTIR
jgi:hypothetical protein